jgi:hypothetical protein
MGIDEKPGATDAATIRELLGISAASPPAPYDDPLFRADAMSGFEIAEAVRLSMIESGDLRMPGNRRMPILPMSNTRVEIMRAVPSVVRSVHYFTTVHDGDPAGRCEAAIVADVATPGDPESDVSLFIFCHDGRTYFNATVPYAPASLRQAGTWHFPEWVPMVPVQERYESGMTEAQILAELDELDVAPLTDEERAAELYYAVLPKRTA